jgi:hypothetical protein
MGSPLDEILEITEGKVVAQNRDEAPVTVGFIRKGMVYAGTHGDSRRIGYIADGKAYSLAKPDSLLGRVILFKDEEYFPKN